MRRFLDAISILQIRFCLGLCIDPLLFSFDVRFSINHNGDSVKELVNPKQETDAKQTSLMSLTYVCTLKYTNIADLRNRKLIFMQILLFTGLQSHVHKVVTGHHLPGFTYIIPI